MSKLVPGNQKHMTQDDRVTIEKGLDSCISRRKIAGSIGKDPSTVSKEIKKHRTSTPNRALIILLNSPNSKVLVEKPRSKGYFCRKAFVENHNSDLYVPQKHTYQLSTFF